MNKEILSSEQKAILSLSEGRHLILSPPGTGKTELLAHRVNKALSDGIDPDKMICLTFTNRAARIMKERIEEVYPNNNVMIGNIHRFSLAFLKKNRLISHFDSVINEVDSDEIIEKAKEIEGIKVKNKNKDILQYNFYLKMKNLGFSEEMLPPTNIPSNDIVQKKICERYEILKKESSILDYDDLLLQAYQKLSENNKNYYLCGYEWLQVDEVQDLNPM